MKKRSLSLALLLACALAAPALAMEPMIIEAIPCQYDGVDSFSEGLFLVRLDGKCGVIDTAGREVVPCKYDDIGTHPDYRFSEGFVSVGVGEYKARKWGFIDKTGKEIVPCKYDGVTEFSEGFAAVSVGEYKAKKWGFVDKTGEEVVPCRYDYVRDFSEGFAAVRVGDWETGKWGFIDQTGEEIIPCQYKEAMPFTKEGAWVRNSNGWGLIDKTGKEIIPCKYANSHSDYNAYPPEFNEGLAIVRGGDDPENYSHSDYMYGAVDAAGNVVIPFEFYRIYPFHDGYAVAMFVNPCYAYAILDKSGQRVDFDVGVFLDMEWNDGLIGASKMLNADDPESRAGGYLDMTGREAIPFRYQFCEPFSEGMGIISKEYVDPISGDLLCMKYGFVDKTGKEIVPYKYTSAEDFHEGYAAVGLDNKAGFIDKTGREVVPCKYDVAISFSNGYARVKLDGKWGVLAIRNPEMAHPSTQSVEVDGKPIEFQCYALKDEAGNLTNFVKLRDVADALNGSPAQFQMDYYSGGVHIVTGWDYTPNGSEGVTPFSGARECLPTIQKVDINGGLTNLEAFTLTDDNGGGYTYFKLRDLGAALGFTVDWSDQRGIYIETDEPAKAL